MKSKKKDHSCQWIAAEHTASPAIGYGHVRYVSKYRCTVCGKFKKGKAPKGAYKTK